MGNFHLLNNQYLADCTNCSCNGSPLVFSYFLDSDNEEVKAIDVLVLAQSPGKQEVELGRPMIGQSGQLINRIIEKYTHRIGYINSLLCRPVGDKTPETLELKCCRERMLGDVKFAIECLNPKIILVFGGSAKKQLKYLQKNCLPMCNIVTYQYEHPAYILRNEHLMPQYVMALHNSLKSVFQEESNVSDTFVTYSDKYKFQFINDYLNTKVVGVDVETNSLNIFSDDFKIGTVAVSCDKNTYFFDCRLKDFRENEVLIGFLLNDMVVKVFADVLFDVVAFKRLGVEINNITDLFPVAFLYDNTHYEYNLEAICLRYKPEYSAYKSKFKATLIDNNYLTADTTTLFHYNSMDSFATRVLYNELYSKLDVGTRKIYETIYKKLLSILVSIKCTGLKVDPNLLMQYKTIYENRFTQISEVLKDKYGITNLSSTPQIRKWMFEQLKLKPIRETDSGASSTDKKTIEYYAEKVPEIKLLFEARSVASRLNYFIPSIQDNVDKNYVIHPNYKHYGVQSGRIACRSPNLQGIPRDKTGFKVMDETPLRRVFVARHPDSYIVEFDYSSQEVRIIAFLAQDQNMIQAFNDGKDIHKYVASIIFKIEYDKVSSFQRQVAKGCVFGAIFGVSAGELAITLKTDEKKAQAYLDKFFNEFPRIKYYIDKQGDLAVQNKRIVSVLGMPRNFIVNRQTINSVRREGANHIVQSVGAAFTFLSLIKIYEWLKVTGLLNNGVLVIHTVHDSIMFDVKKEHLQFVITKVIEIMESVPSLCKFTIAYPVEYKIGKRWGEDEKLMDIINDKPFEEVYNVTEEDF